jgi:ATP-dependent RNA helicase RhlE
MNDQTTNHDTAAAAPASFDALKLVEPIARALRAENYATPTPIQARAIPHLLEGHDLLGIAQTGTGKTAAFALPILQRLAADKRRAPPRSTRVLVLTPTRELAVQIHQSFRTYGKNLHLFYTAIFGGVGQGQQVSSVSRGVDVVIATPGRLLDLVNQGHLKLDAVEVFVLDEADRMLDMGFIHDVRRIVAKLPKKRQTVLFSATMPQAISGLAASVLVNPKRVEVTPPATTVERINQKVLFVEKDKKRALLLDLLADKGIARALVFTRTKHGANRLAEQLGKSGVSTDAIHGNKSQGQRQRALDSFRNGRLRVLVATDIAARGIDIDGITHVINFDLPNEPESYVHRIGRTARAGAAGHAISFCDAEERSFLRDIEKAIRRPVPVHAEHPFHVEFPAHGHRSQPQKKQGRPQWRGNRGRNDNRGRRAA